MSEINLKNQYSEVSAERTISYIEGYLAACGVTGISKQIDNGKPVALFFHIDLGASGNFTVRLPAKVADVQEYLWRQYCSTVNKPRKTKADFADQACRTAWKIQQDWVQVQMSLIKLKQADFIEVFMGFLWDGKQSYYEQLKAGGYKALPESSGA